ncbi:MAG: sugar-binding protein [Clostridia bacterium]|nr:sugar-binding protein [Clostridia bacterium]
MMKKLVCLVLALMMSLMCVSALADGQKVGVSMPTKDLQRWNQDGENMQKLLEEASYEVDLQFASNDVQQQLNQVTNMINNGCDVIVIAAIEGSSLGSALDLAKEKGIPVIAYDRLLMESDAVSYYATFDNYMVGTKQGTYIKEALDLDNAEGPFALEITAGDPGDNNARYFYQGALDVLQPYLDAGKLTVKSGQIEFTDVATPTWKTEVAQTRADGILASYYSDGSSIDAWLCSNDSTALGVTNALEANYDGEWPIITGQDCDISNVKNMIAGKQRMSVFKDTRTLAAQVVKMVGQILAGETVDVNDTTTYDNNKIVVPSFLCEPVFADVNNYAELLLDSGYYTADQLQ